MSLTPANFYNLHNGRRKLDIKIIDFLRHFEAIKIIIDNLRGRTKCHIKFICFLKTDLFTLLEVKRFVRHQDYPLGPISIIIKLILYTAIKTKLMKIWFNVSLLIVWLLKECERLGPSLCPMKPRFTTK